MSPIHLLRDLTNIASTEADVVRELDAANQQSIQAAGVLVIGEPVIRECPTMATSSSRTRLREAPDRLQEGGQDAAGGARRHVAGESLGAAPMSLSAGSAIRVSESNSPRVDE